MEAHSPTTSAGSGLRSIFDRVLVGVDGTKPSLGACRLAACLAQPGTKIEAATVTLFPSATAAALGVPELAEGIDRDAGSVLEAAARILGPGVELRHLDGLTADALLDELKRMRTTLLAIGAPTHRRVDEIVFGGIAAELLHKAPCSMLVARPVADEANFPSKIVVGIDGSAGADHAHDVARGLADRRDTTVRLVVARGGKRVNLGEIAHRYPWVEESAAAPVPALVDASNGADLLVVGSRGLHGPRVLGSVAERVAYRASCPVLVVR